MLLRGKEGGQFNMVKSRKIVTSVLCGLMCLGVSPVGIVGATSQATSGVSPSPVLTSPSTTDVPQSTVVPSITPSASPLSSPTATPVETKSGKLKFTYSKGENKVLLSADTDGTVLFSVMENGKYVVYNDVRHYDKNGKLVSSKKNSPVFTNDYSTWYEAFTDEVQNTSKGTDFYRDLELDAYPVFDRKPTKDKSNWSALHNMIDGVKYKLRAVIRYSDGTYSDVTEYEFTANSGSDDDKKEPTLSVVAIESNSNYIKYRVTAKSNAPIIRATVTRDGDEVHRVALYDDLKNYTFDYIAEVNGAYEFTVRNEYGVEKSITKSVSNLSGAGSGESAKGDAVSDIDDNSAPTLTFSGIPKTISLGETFDLIVKSNEKCSISFNGDVFENTTEAKFPISGNDVYEFTAIDSAGNIGTYKCEIKCFNEKEIADGFELDDRALKNTSNISDRLPQTGGFTLIASVLAGIACIGGGAYMVKRAGSANNKSKEESHEE